MLPSLAPSRPRTRRVRYPRASSRRVSVIAWIDGPPTLSRAMIRTKRTVSASGDIGALIPVLVDTQPMGSGPEALTTVLMPVWDEYVPWLAQAVRSVQEQDAAARLVVVDNASDARLPALPGVCVVTSSRRLTLGAARNLGLTHVATPYVVVWDADDTMIPGTLGVMEDAKRSDPTLAAFGTAIVEEPSGRRHRWPRRWVPALARLPRIFALLDCVWSLYPTTGATIMRTELARSGGGYSDAESGDDWCLGVSLAFRGRLGWSERPGRAYRLHPHSIWSRHRTVRDLLRHARAVRDRIRHDPAIGRSAEAALPLITLGQYGAVLGHVGLSATRSLRPFAASGASRGARGRPTRR